MLKRHATLPRGARILLTADPFSTEEYTPSFLLELLYRDPGLKVDRTSMMAKPPADWDAYQYVFVYEGNQYRQLKP
jgi:hypothetical protein